MRIILLIRNLIIFPCVCTPLSRIFNSSSFHSPNIVVVTFKRLILWLKPILFTTSPKENRFVVHSESVFDRGRHTVGFVPNDLIAENPALLITHTDSQPVVLHCGAFWYQCFIFSWRPQIFLVYTDIFSILFTSYFYRSVPASIARSAIRVTMIPPHSPSLFQHPLEFSCDE